ncbi:MAG TPA: DinB family protein [Acidimicrobiales bacterium]|nr:DinB family protein [Acidimicrobiales bacterium]
MRGRCAECGFDADHTSVPDSIVALRTFPRRWRAAFALLDEEDDEVLRRRPAPQVWSALEYLAHTRDMAAVHGLGMGRTLTENHPTFERPAGMTEESLAEGYGGLDVGATLDELAANLGRVADRADRTDAGDWVRPATIREPDGNEEEVDARWFLHHIVHEASHHLRDVHRVLQQVRGRPGR